MKKIFLALTVLGFAAVGASTAHAGISFSFSVPAPVVTYAAPVYSYCPPPPPRVVYVQPAPVVVYRPPVYCAPAPVCVAAAPVVRFGFHFGPRYHAFHHGCW